jgi:chaperonin GroEL
MSFYRKIRIGGIMSKIVLFDKDAQDKIISGVSKLSRIVGVTMGPRGKNVIIGKPVGAPVITKDGVSVARQVILDDPIEELASQLVKEVAGRTAVVAGDGTTTATVLTDEIMSLSREVLKDTNPIDFRDGLNWAKNQIIEILDKNTKYKLSDEDIINIATISTNSDKELGQAIGEAFIWAGKLGTVGAEAYPNVKTQVRKVDGVSLKKGFCSPNFLSKGDTELLLENAYILLVDRKLTHVNDCSHFLNEVAKTNRPLLVLSKGVEKAALDTFIENNKKGFLNVCCVDLPKKLQNGNSMEDLSILTGATVFSDILGTPLSSAALKDLGSAERIVIDRLTTQIFNSEIQEERRTEKLRLYREDSLQPISDQARKEIRDYMSFLSCKAAMITVGYDTELELREKGDRVEDAMHATDAAIEEGILPGGGVSLLRAAKELSESNIPGKYLPAAQVLISACVRPFKQIMSNADLDYNSYLHQIYECKEFYYGYNIISGEIENLVETGVVDPSKVTRTAVSNAVSVSLLLINTNAVLAERKDDPSAWQPQPGWRPPDGTLNHKY